MARYNLNDDDLKFFFETEFDEFKKGISKRVSCWKTATNSDYKPFLFMLVERVVKSKINNQKLSLDWNFVIEKLIHAKYVFSASNCMPKFKKWHELSNPIFVESYLELLKKFNDYNITFEEKDVVNMYSLQEGNLNSEIIEYFKSIGIYPEKELEEIKINHTIANLLDNNLESLFFKKAVREVYADNDNYTYGIDNNIELTDKEIEKLDEYRKIQKEKISLIESYIDENEISEEKAKKIFKYFKVSYEKMDSIPVLKNKYFGDILVSLNCSNKLRNEYFYTEEQLYLIKRLENKSNSIFIGELNDSYFNQRSFDKPTHERR